MMISRIPRTMKMRMSRSMFRDLPPRNSCIKGAPSPCGTAIGQCYRMLKSTEFRVSGFEFRVSGCRRPGSLLNGSLLPRGRQLCGCGFLSPGHDDPGDDDGAAHHLQGVDGIRKDHDSGQRAEERLEEGVEASAGGSQTVSADVPEKVGGE